MPELNDWLNRLESEVISMRIQAKNWRSFLEVNQDLHGFTGIIWMNMGNIEGACESVLRRIEEAKSKDKEVING